VPGADVVLNTQVAHISRVRTIAAEPQVIWAVLADFGSVSTWAAFVDHSCLLESTPEDGPLGLVRRIQLGRNTVLERIVEFDAPRALSYDIEGMPRLVRRLHSRWELQATTGGCTEVMLTTTVDIGPRLPQRLAERVMCRLAAKQCHELIAGLANHVEGRHARIG
jgi:Polyketide cyclase / dehydrase and lipid transport